MVTLIFADKNGAKIYIHRCKMDITGHPLNSVKLSTGESIKYLIDLKDGSWELPWVQGGQDVTSFTLNYDVPARTLNQILGPDIIQVKNEPENVFEGCLTTGPFKMSRPVRDVIKAK